MIEILVGMFGCIGLVIVLGLASVGVWSLASMVKRADGRGPDPVRQGEQQVTDIGEQARFTIMREAMQRAYGTAGQPVFPEGRAGSAGDRR